MAKQGHIDRAVTAFLRDYCMNLMRAYRWNVQKAAAHAGRDRSSFHRLLRRVGVVGGRRG